MVTGRRQERKQAALVRLHLAGKQLRENTIQGDIASSKAGLQDAGTTTYAPTLPTR